VFLVFTHFEYLLRKVWSFTKLCLVRKDLVELSALICFLSNCNCISR